MKREYRAPLAVVVAVVLAFAYIVLPAVEFLARG